MKNFFQMKKLLVPAMVMLFIVFLISYAAAEAEPGQADPGPGIDIQMDVLKEVTEMVDGKPVTTYVPVETAKKGDVLQYRMTYTNGGDTAASDAAVIGPIPKETAYVADSATGEETEITYSIDGGATFHVPPIAYTVKKPDGTVEKKTASPDMYTHIRFAVKKSLNPGQTGLSYFKVMVK